MATEALSLDDLKAFLARKAGGDDAFRASLLADPKATVAQLLGTELPAHVTIRAVEEAPDTYVVVVPADPPRGELSDADLESVAGGTSKADDLRSVQNAASLVFGLGPSLAADLFGVAAQAAHNDHAHKQLSEAGRDIGTCGARHGGAR